MTNTENEVQYVNADTDEQMEIFGYTRSILRTVISWICIVLTVGFLRLVFYWKPEWMLKATHRKCKLNEASYVLLKDKYDQWFVESIFLLTGYKKELSFETLDELKNTEVQEKENSSIKYFTNKRWKYIWNQKMESFHRLKGDEEQVAIPYYHRCRGLTRAEQENKRKLYGINSIKIDLTPMHVLLFREVLSPFYIFQIFSCLLWFFDNYYYYASTIALISIISIVYSLYSIRYNERSLRDIIHNTSKVTVFRYDQSKRAYEEEISSEDLVPGDVIAVQNMSIMQCDAVVLNGNVIVNESMLTGESLPVTKIPLSNIKITDIDEISNDLGQAKLNMKEHNKHILFSGTQVIQTRYYSKEKVKAVVLRTGFITTKGELVRQILHPKPVDFRFNADTYKYVGALSVLAGAGMIYAIVIKVLKMATVGYIIKRSLDIITIAVPPALPGALTAGLIYAQNRLRKEKIFCISPRTINICGSINTFVFDKTGTLTEDGLDMKFVIPSKSMNNDSSPFFDDQIDDVSGMKFDSSILKGMASCHSITRINGELAGDPLDCKMFEFTKWDLIEPTLEESAQFNMLVPTIVQPKKAVTIVNDAGEIPYQIGILKQFPFSSSLQRMSVVVRDLSQEKFELFCKGSPEKIAELAKPDTLPKDFQQVLTSYTKEGYRVIALSRKALDMNYVTLQRAERDKIENDLEFIGLIIMENRLKPQTTPVINNLNAANIRTVMCTGDNILTALSVARDCEMIDEDERVIIVEAESGQSPRFTYPEIVKQKVKEIEFDPKTQTFREKEKGSQFVFAVNGKSFAVIREEHQDLLEKLAVRGAVFARMSPEQKQQLIETLQDLGYYVGMCGDGANDCGALKAANAGISLSDAEASVASPFTSKNANIECVPLVIREGRAALVTSFGVVKFICMYSMIQFVTVLVLYSINGSLTDMEFLYIDLILVTLIAFFFCRTEAFPELHKNPPLNKLMAWRPILSLLGHLVIVLGIQVFTFFYVQSQPWFEAYEESDDDDVEEVASYENTAVFCVSMFQYISQSIVFSKGAPYRRSVFGNTLFMFTIVITTIICAILTLWPIEAIYDFFELEEIPDLKFRFIIICFAFIHFFLSFLYETFVIEGDLFSTFDTDTKKSIPNDNQDVTPRCVPVKEVKMRYEKIEYELKKDSKWPPITPQQNDKNTTENI